MKKLIYLVGFVILLSCKSEKQDERLDTIDRYLLGQVENFKFNGNVLIAEKGKVIYKKSFGVRDFYTNEPLNDSSIFEIASVSKQFTAMGMLLLEKQGKLSLSDSLRHYFPELSYTSISIHHLLTHTSGLPDHEQAMRSKWDHKKIASNSDMISLLAKENIPVNFKPGTKWEYSNTGYALLASIIEKVSGMTFADFMATAVFEPLDMKHTGVYHRRLSGEQVGNMAYGFTWSSSLKKHVPPDSLTGYEFVYYQDGIDGDGSINSTIDDLLKWDRALVNGTLFGDATVTKLISPYVLSDTIANTSYGYGVFLGKDHLGTYVGHTGYWPGSESSLTRYINDNRTIIVLSNNESAARFIQAGIANILFDQPITLPYQHKPIKLDSLSLDLFTGSFRFYIWDFDIIREKDTLFQVFGPGYRRIYLPESSSKIFPVDGQDIQFEITKTDQNEVKHYVVVYGVKEEMRNSQK